MHRFAFVSLLVTAAALIVVPPASAEMRRCGDGSKYVAFDRQAFNTSCSVVKAIIRRRNSPRTDARCPNIMQRCVVSDGRGHEYRCRGKRSKRTNGPPSIGSFRVRCHRVGWFDKSVRWWVPYQPE